MPWSPAAFTIKTVKYVAPQSVTITGSGFDGTELVALVNGATAIDLLTLMRTGVSTPQGGVIQCVGKATGGTVFEGAVSTAGAKPGAYSVFMLQINQEKLEVAAAPASQAINL